jgi:hypothetical protein
MTVSGRAVAAGGGVQRRGSRECLFCEGEVGVDVDLGGGDAFVAEPQGAMTVLSTPAASRRIAAVCRSFHRSSCVSSKQVTMACPRRELNILDNYATHTRNPRIRLHFAQARVVAESRRGVSF